MELSPSIWCLNHGEINWEAITLNALTNILWANVTHSMYDPQVKESQLKATSTSFFRWTSMFKLMEEIKWKWISSQCLFWATLRYWCPHLSLWYLGLLYSTFSNKLQVLLKILFHKNYCKNYCVDLEVWFMRWESLMGVPILYLKTLFVPYWLPFHGNVFCFHCVHKYWELTQGFKKLVEKRFRASVPLLSDFLLVPLLKRARSQPS